MQATQKLFDMTRDARKAIKKERKTKNEKNSNNNNKYFFNGFFPQMVAQREGVF